MKLFDLFAKRAPLESVACDTETTGGGTRLITRVLRAEGLRELELPEVPADIVPEATDLLSRMRLVVLRDRPSRDGETIAGQLVDEAQPVLHVATLRVISRTIEPGSPELFRVVDVDEPASSRRPFRLLATHLALLATRERNVRHRLRLGRRSVELFEGQPAVDDGRFAFDRGENLENFFGWETLADGLVDSGEIDEGIAALRNAAARCPAWANDFASHVRLMAGAESSRDPRIQFWLKW